MKRIILILSIVFISSVCYSQLLVLQGEFNCHKTWNNNRWSAYSPWEEIDCQIIINYNTNHITMGMVEIQMYSHIKSYNEWVKGDNVVSDEYMCIYENTGDTIRVTIQNYNNGTYMIFVMWPIDGITICHQARVITI